VELFHFIPLGEYLLANPSFKHFSDHFFMNIFLPYAMYALFDNQRARENVFPLKRKDSRENLLEVYNLLTKITDLENKSSHQENQLLFFVGSLKKIMKAIEKKVYQVSYSFTLSQKQDLTHSRLKESRVFNFRPEWLEKFEMPLDLTEYQIFDLTSQIPMMTTKKEYRND
jgi:hypothetical protein